MKTKLIHLTGCLTTLLALAAAAHAQTTAFTYQGRLTENGIPANSTNDLTFTLYTTDLGSVTVGVGNVVNNLVVSNGLFTVTLDYGASAFDGSERWLQIAARPGTSVGAYTNLLPRQRLTSTPYAIRALSAGSATTASGVAPGAVTSAGLAPGAVGGAAIADGSITSADLNPSLLNNTFWKLTGNAGTTPGTSFFGTTDDQPVEFKVNGGRALRLEPNLVTPNVIGGLASNQVANGAWGATIGGGGYFDAFNVVGGNFGTVSGGRGNTANSAEATVAGGRNNTASGGNSAVSGGYANTASGSLASVGGGFGNVASGTSAFIAGGSLNAANNDNTFAGGQRAKANHAGSFVWADSESADFASTTSDQFSIRARGGLQLSPLTSMNFGQQTRQMLNLWSTVYGIGVQSYTTYFRTDTDGSFGWYQGGAHSDGLLDPGTGGQKIMSLNSSGLTVSNVKLEANPNGAIELGPTSAAFAVPFIDFHYGVNAAQDFNVRLINDADRQLTCSGNLAFGNQTRQMINLYNTDYGIGVQSGTMYFRTGDSPGAQEFAWYRGGTHSDGHFDPGTGGTDMMRLNTAGLNVRGNVYAILFLPNSDRNKKENFTPINPSEVLAKVVSMPITRWNYKEAKDTVHIGAMAQDFYAAFAVGPDDKHIATVDADGVALAAIQGLNQKVDDQHQQLERKDSKIRELEQRMEKLERLILRASKE